MLVFLSSTLYVLCIETKRNFVNQNKGNNIYAFLAINKAKHILNRLFFRAPVVTQFMVKVLSKIEKSPIFESLSFLY